MIDIEYKPKFLRKFNQLPEALKVEVEEKISLFLEDQNHSFLKTHKLTGKLKGTYSFSVNYDLRIIFTYNMKNEVSLLTIGNHDIYK